MRMLTEAMESALADGRRRPAYRILAFDPKVDSLSAVVTGKYTQEPFDLTPYCTEISWTPAQLGFTLADPEGVFHPDTGASRKYLADGAIIRLKEGDSRVSEDNWVWTFTGQIRGQIGWRKSRRSKTLESKITVFSRENNQAYKRRQVTSKEYTVGTDIGVMLYDLCRTFLGLTESEIRIPAVLGLQFRHKVNQMAQMTPWDAVGTILQTVCYVPFFDGEGRLAYYNKSLSRPPDRILPDYIRMFDYEIPARNQDAVNRVKVVFLDSQLEQVDGPYQKLGTAQVTTGFFSMGEKLDCWWSEDHKQRASGTHLKVIKSVNSGLLPVGTESYQEIDQFHGRIKVQIAVWVPILATAMIAAYIAAAAIPDEVVAPLGAGVTIPVGRIIQAGAMVAILVVMMSLGSAQYEVWGTPYDMAYLEKESIAVEDGISYWEENEKEIKNDFIGSHEQADTVAVTELIWEKSSSLPRRLLIDDDLALELGDIVVLPDGRKFLITNLAKQIKRGEVPILTLDGFKVMTA
jgi:hypothetical protein